MGELPNKTKQAFVQLKVDVRALPPCLQRTWHVTINRIMRRNHETLPMSSLCFMRFYSLYAWTTTYLKTSWQWICNRPTLFKFTGRCMEVVLHPARGANHKVGWRKWKEFSDIHSAVQKGWLVTSWQDKMSSEFRECQRFAPCRQFSEPLCSFDSQAESKDWQVVPSGSFLIRYARPCRAMRRSIRMRVSSNVRTFNGRIALIVLKSENQIDQFLRYCELPGKTGKLNPFMWSQQ